MDLTPSEKVEVARRIEEITGNRQGQRTDLKAEIEQAEQPRQNFAEVNKDNRRSSAIAAKAVDMNRETYRQAKDTPGYVVGVGVYIRVKVLYVCPRGFLLT